MVQDEGQGEGQDGGGTTHGGTLCDDQDSLSMFFFSFFPGITSIACGCYHSLAVSTGVAMGESYVVVALFIDLLTDSLSRWHYHDGWGSVCVWAQQPRAIGDGRRH
jgi:hypothetical protein